MIKQIQKLDIMYMMYNCGDVSVSYMLQQELTQQSKKKTDKHQMFIKYRITNTCKQKRIDKATLTCV